jgi:hypothetical protein
LCRHTEKSFQIQDEDFCDAFEVNLWENSEGARKFCLSAIEIFGILKKISDEDEILEEQKIL